jgi:hypothetical protein
MLLELDRHRYLGIMTHQKIGIMTHQKNEIAVLAFVCTSSI